MDSYRSDAKMSRFRRTWVAEVRFLASASFVIRGSKIISLIDDPVGEVFADIKVIGQRGSTLTEQSIL